ncbi:MAG: exodeoxyribonuclease VII large subunit [Rhodocyclaceae bacterium]|nr:exodeoxyribonuclease VII large subunit [Rhodocyclaceae bacterium]
MMAPPPPLTVSELNRRARELLESGFPLLWVSGEISNLARAPSGHVYFTLKDESAQVRCALFRSRAQLVPFRLENGQCVDVQALVTLYEARGEFQLTIEAMRRAGMGRLYELFLKLRQRLEAEGLFAAERKKPLPRFPARLGVITSPSAAALRDVLAACRRRAPHLELILYPSLVQGEAAPASLMTALEQACERAECDLLLIVRGGGSLEDLWAFNDEAFVRRLASASLPTIVGVGHETDITLADLAADVRAATPTAAAELATAGWFATRRELRTLSDRLAQAMRRRLSHHAQILDRLALRLSDPRQRLRERRQRLSVLAHRLAAALHKRLGRARERFMRYRLALLKGAPLLARMRLRQDRLSTRLQHAMAQTLDQRRRALERLSHRLQALSPLAVLARGYSIVRTETGEVVTHSDAVHVDQTVELIFARGRAHARILATDL